MRAAYPPSFGGIANMNIRQRKFLMWCVPVLAAVTIATVTAAKGGFVVGVQPDGRIMVPTGRVLTPAGVHIDVNDRPLGMALSPNGALMAVATGSNFNPRALHIIDVASRTLKQTI